MGAPSATVTLPQTRNGAETHTPSWTMGPGYHKAGHQAPLAARAGDALLGGLEALRRK